MSSAADIALLVGRLEDAWVDPAAASIETVTAMLAERQEILTQIQSADGFGLDSASRERLAARIRAVHGRDKSLLEALSTLRDNVAKALDSLAGARSAVRGYRPAEFCSGLAIDRSA